MAICAMKPKAWAKSGKWKARRIAPPSRFTVHSGKPVISSRVVCASRGVMKSLLRCGVPGAQPAALDRLCSLRRIADNLLSYQPPDRRHLKKPFHEHRHERRFLASVVAGPPGPPHPVGPAGERAHQQPGTGPDGAPLAGAK